MDARSKYFIEDECNWHNTLLEDAEVDHKVSIGTIVYADDYEVFVREAGVDKETYFTDFKDAFEYCKIRYPEAKWDNLG